jgi:nucleotide-binding universal stress UspA family protein
MSAAVVQEAIDRAREDGEAIEAAAMERLNRSGLRYGTECAVTQMSDIGRRVADRARFSDLVVLPLPYGKDKGIDQEAVLEAALFEGQTPVLVVPDGASLATPPRRVMIAWNESAEALTAVRAALPMLRTAASAQIVVIDPPTRGQNRSDPGGMLAQYLARHGVSAEIDVLARTMPQISDVLKRQARETGADMLVMGAYGHSRFREAILGGATRNMLSEAPLPVFMAH